MDQAVIDVLTTIKDVTPEVFGHLVHKEIVDAWLGMIFAFIIFAACGVLGTIAMKLYKKLDRPWSSDDFQITLAVATVGSIVGLIVFLMNISGIMAPEGAVINDLIILIIRVRG